MFTIRCTTCQAGLAVKNEELVGQILACPKCGGMVLVQRPDDEPTPLDKALEEEPQQQFVKFPDPATYETDSGIMKPDEIDAIKAAAQAAAPQPPEPPALLTESELRTRKILLSALVGLLLMLVVAVGVMISLKGNRPELEPIAANEPVNVIQPLKTEPKVPAVKPEPVKIEPAAVEPIAEPVDNLADKPIANREETQSDEAKEKKRDLLANLLARTLETPTDETKGPEAAVEPVVEPELKPEEPAPKMRAADDLLSALERKMPGLLAQDDVLTVDVPARLALPIAELKLDGTPLLGVVRAFTEWTEIPVTLDVDEFRCRGIRVDTPLTKQLGADTAGNLLTKILAELELEPVIEDRQILVTVSEERRRGLLERRFDVADFGEDSPAERLADLVRQLVDPAGFNPKRPGDDTPMMRVDGSSLVVRHRLRMLDESLRLLEQLRVIRGLPQKTEVVGELLVPEAFGWDAVVQPMTLNYYTPTPLAGILKQLEEKTKLRILVDHRALHRALCPLDTMKATVRCNRGTVNETLESLLASIDTALLTYRIVGHDVLEITTAYAARQPEKMSLEIHRYETPEKPLAAGETPENLVQTIRSALEPGTWRNPADPETIGLGDIVIDRPSGCLIVRQSQPIQRQLRLWLGKKFDSNKDNNPD